MRYDYLELARIIGIPREPKMHLYPTFIENINPIEEIPEDRKYTKETFLEIRSGLKGGVFYFQIRKDRDPLRKLIWWLIDLKSMIVWQIKKRKIK